MEAKKFNIKESELFDNDDFLTESDGEDDTQQEEQKRVSPEQIRIDSLKLALKIIKMFDKVTAEDLLNVSSQVSSYLINHQAGTEYEATDLDLSGDKTSDENDSDETEDLDNNDINLDDMDDFTIDDSENADDESENDSENTEDTSDDESEEDNDEEDTNEGSGLLPDEFVI